jgi:hypothetical protein
MARKVDEAANFVFVQLIEQEPGIYDERHPNDGRQDKIDLAWETISHETNESGSRLNFFETILSPQFKLSQENGCTQCFLNIEFKHPVALIYNLLHIYFRLKCNVLLSHPSSTLHGSAVRVYGHHKVSSILLKLLYCILKFRIACERYIS